MKYKKIIIKKVIRSKHEPKPVQVMENKSFSDNLNSERSHLKLEIEELKLKLD